MSGCYHQGAGDEIAQLSSFIRCFTERLKERYAEERRLKNLLDAERMRLDAVLQAIPDPVYLVNQNRTIVYANKAMTDTFGELVGGVCHREIFQNESPCSFCPIERVDVGAVEDFEVFNPALKRFFHINCVAVEDSGAGEKQFLLIARDITKFKEYESRLVVDEKLRAVGLLSAGIAHDLNNVLAMIMGRISLWEADKTFPPDRKKGLEKILNACERGRDIIQRLQRFRTNQRAQEHTSIPLKSLVEEMIQLSKPKWKNMALVHEAEYRFHVDIPTDLSIAGVENEMAEVFLNLIFNSIEAMPKGGDILIRAWQEGSLVHVEIRDTGEGMSKQVLQRVFDPFFSTKPSGTGLGLSIVYSIIKDQGGSLNISSTPGKGTTIRFSVPLAQRPGTLESGPSQSLETNLSGLKVLVVDDEVSVRELAGEMLSSHGVDVRLAGSGAEALEMIKEETPDVVLTDIGMPKMSGWTLAEEIRKLGLDVPILFMSGYLDIKSDSRLKDLGPCGVIGKPFRFTDLTSELQKMWEKEQGTTS